MERRKPSFISSEKGHPSKKNAGETSRRTRRNKRKPSKLMISSEESSSDEMVNNDEPRNDRAEMNSCATAGESKESIGKPEIDRIRASTSEPLKKEQTTKQNVEETSSSKGNGYKRITSREKRFSGEMVNIGSFRERPYPIHSRAFSEDNSYLKASKKMERPSSSETLRKMDFEEEISQPTQSSRTYQNMDYYEDNSTEESETGGNPAMGSDFSSKGGDNTRQEWYNYQPLPTVIKKTENHYFKREDSGEKITFGFFPLGLKSDTMDDRLDADEFSRESSPSEALPSCGNLSKSGISKPFSNWANVSYVMRPFKADKEPENDDRGVQYGAWAQMNLLQTNKDFQKYRDLKLQHDHKVKQSTSKTDDDESQFQEDTFESITPMVGSPFDVKRKHDGTESAGNAFEENPPKVVNFNIVKKEGEETKDFTSWSKIDDAKEADKMFTYDG